MLGFQIGGYFTAIYQDYTFADTLSKKHFKEVIHIGKAVNKKDSAYWAKNRPIPLTIEEQKLGIKKPNLFNLNKGLDLKLICRLYLRVRNLHVFHI